VGPCFLLRPDCEDRGERAGIGTPAVGISRTAAGVATIADPVLFFNADVVQHKINKNGGAMAFVDDYTAWVTGPSATANRERIQKVIDRALEWERRSGAPSECSKTVVQHFTRDEKRTDASPFTINGQDVVPREEVRILSVTMDSKLRYRSQIVNAATKGLRAAMALKRLRSLSPSTAR
jgi:hypothetical protein